MKIVFFFSLILLALLIYATLIPFEEAWDKIYSSFWFEGLFFVLAFMLIFYIVKFRVYKKFPVFLLHLGILVILLGAFVTRHFGVEGVIHLREGQVSDSFMVMKNMKVLNESKKLGFKLKLIDFKISTYPGSFQPQDFISEVEVIDKDKKFRYTIHMNHILIYKGYRIYQADFDKDHKGSLLLVNYDPGVYITYTGYVLFSLGFVLSFIRRVKYLISAFLLAFLPYSAYGMDTFEKSLKTAESFSSFVVASNRVKSMDSLDLEIAYKLTKKRSIYGMDYNRLVVGMLSYPEIFKNVKLIYIEKPIRKFFNNQKYVSFNELFKNGEFIYLDRVKEAFSKSDLKKSKIDRVFIKLNDRVFVASLVFSGEIFRIFPKGDNFVSVYKAPEYKEIFVDLIKALRSLDYEKVDLIREKLYKIQFQKLPNLTLSKKEIELEKIYNRLNLNFYLMWVYLVLAVLMFIVMVIDLVYGKKVFEGKVLYILTLIAFLAQSAYMILRWYISSHAPWANAYESVVFISWAAVLVSLLIRNYAVSFGALFIAFGFLLVAHLSELDPQITNLVPVLNSYWLLVHVAIITLSYGFLGVGAVLGLINHFTKKLDKILYLDLYIGLMLLSIGTFLGGVWANESWGRYWSWDVKETWSLISMIVYAIVLHLRGKYFSLLSFFSFFFILFTYFGVNFYLSTGLHAYAIGEGNEFWIYTIFLGMGIWFVIILLALIRGK